MENVERGMMAWSKAGHDKERLYIIIELDEHYVYLVDGKTRPLKNPKKKKWKHVQVMKKIPKEIAGLDLDQIKDEEIKRAIKLLSKNQEV